MVLNRIGNRINFQELRTVAQKNFGGSSRHVYNAYPVVQYFKTPSAASTDTMIASQASATSAQNITSFTSQPNETYGDDKGARGLVLTLAGTTADLTASTIVATCQDVFGGSFTVGFTIIENHETDPCIAALFKTGDEHGILYVLSLKIPYNALLLF